MPLARLGNAHDPAPLERTVHAALLLRRLAAAVERYEWVGARDYWEGLEWLRVDNAE